MPSHAVEVTDIVKGIASHPLIALWSKAIPEVRKELESASPERKIEYQKYAGTVCDLTAASIMGCTVGFHRLEKVKSADGLSKRDDHNCVPLLTACGSSGSSFVYRTREGKGNANAFFDAFQDWALGARAGMAQLKFQITEAHTLVIERLSSGMFRLYQSYEGMYSLREFLGGSGRTVSAQLADGIANKYHGFGRHATEHRRITPGLFLAMREALGNFKKLTLADINRRVIVPLCDGLASGAMNSAAYTQLVGLPAGQQDPACTWLGMLLFNGLMDPFSMFPTYESIVDGRVPSEVTGWPAIPE